MKSKSILAKLLASENLSVEVRNVNTAFFDLKNRIIVIPSWKDISEEVYDLFLGHEVGHALHTPEEGWHDSITDIGKEFKSYLNVIEDVRIEKLVKEKYPGLKYSFYKAYNELNQKDFFGINSRSTATRLLIDRINLHYKIGSMISVNFLDKEQVFLDQIEKIKTWEDVVRIAKDIFNHDKENQHLYSDGLEDYGSEFLLDENLDDLDDYDSIPLPKPNEFDKNSLPESETDKFFRKNQESISSNDKTKHVNVIVPEPYLEKIIVPYKELYQYINLALELPNNIETKSAFNRDKHKIYLEFLTKHKTHINYLVKEFELRKNAKQYARAKVAKTGELDLKKVFSYKLKDDIFKQVTIVPKGKSHGLVMFTDLSGSMKDNIGATIEQTIVLAMFCRKVGIPFKIYGFSDNYSSTVFYKKQDGPKFSSNVNEFDANFNTKFHLKEYLSDDMSSSEFNNAIKTWLYISKFYLNSNRNYFLGNVEDLSNTPLQETIISAIKIVSNFKQNKKLDIVNTILLTDGEANEIARKITDVYGQREHFALGYVPSIRIHIRHKESGKETTINDTKEITNGLLEILKEVTDTKVIGIYLVDKGTSLKRGIVSAARTNNTFVNDLDEAVKIARKDKVFCLECRGYTKQFVVPSLEIVDEELEVEKTGSKNAFKTAFLKLRRNKNSSRILLNKFVETIA